MEAPLVTIDDTAASADAAVGGVAGGGGVVAEVDLDHAVFTPMVKAEAGSIERNHPRPSCCGHTQQSLANQRPVTPLHGLVDDLVRPRAATEVCTN